MSWLTGVGSARQRGTQPGHTHKLSARLRVCVCFRLGFAVSRCLADGHWAHREAGGGRSSNKPFRTESEYTCYTEMLYEKPM